MTPGHASEPDTWYAGTSPQGLFKSEDGGNNWEPFDSYNNFPLIKTITKDNGGTPIGPLLHSINVDPRDKNHICLAMSAGGFFETREGLIGELLIRMFGLIFTLILIQNGAIAFTTFSFIHLIPI